MADKTQVTIPNPHAVFEAVMEDGAIVRLRRHGVAGGPRLVLSHGNGLAIDGYFSFWGRLLDRYDVIVTTSAIMARTRRIIPLVITGKDSSSTTNASGTRSASSGAPSRWSACFIRSRR
jgi:hypothetical protein